MSITFSQLVDAIAHVHPRPGGHDLEVAAKPNPFVPPLLGPARPQIVYRAEFTGTLAPGIYSVEGTLVAKDRPLSVTLVIQVQ